MTHKERIQIVQFLVQPSTLKSDKHAYGREIKILKKLTDGGKYDDLSFWTSLSYPAYFNSLAVFVKGELAQDLEMKWRYFCMEKIQREQYEISRLQNSPTISLDNETNSPKMEGMREPVSARKQNVVDWIDSPTE